MCYDAEFGRFVRNLRMQIKITRGHCSRHGTISYTNDFPLEITGLGLYRAPILSRTVSEINGNFRRK